MFLTILSSLFHLDAEVHAALFTELIGNISWTRIDLGPSKI